MSTPSAQILSTQPGDTPLQLLQIQRRFVERLMRGAGILVLVYLPLLLWQAYHLGWLPRLKMNAVAMLAPLLCWLFADRLSLDFRAGVVLAGTALLGFGAGLYGMGMAGAGYWWCVQSALYAATIYSTRIGLIMAGLCLLGMVAIAFGFTSGALTPLIDANAATRDASVWSGFLVVVVLVPMLMLFVFRDYQQTILRLAAEVEAQRSELARRVGHDELTGLPRNTLLADRLYLALRRAARDATKVALLFIDLDGFKGVNDGFGHAAGDHLLRHVAQRLRASVREQDTVARVGGDEFVVILLDVQHEAAVCRLAESIIARTSGSAVPWQGQQLAFGMSVGIALFPDHAQDPAALRALADAAMYASKAAGRNGWRVARAEARDDGADPQRA